ncbi:MAG: glutamyl-tRNA reductase, partial [Solirubrobacteraceae bacterium]|nr:glutamyl-tRNA reductase [Solirubrobacteraceae bacterium]
RERLALSTGRSVDFLRELRADASVREAVALSTCNRLELYLVASEPVEAETAALGMLARQAGIRPTELASAIYALRNCDAARHLFRVTSGLESMIVGEAEVQGQVKRAYEVAVGAGVAGPLTHKLFRAALQTGKRVRTETAVGERHASVSSVAAALAGEELGDLAGREVVILGAGETSELTARALSRQGVAAIFVANRRHDRALGLARRYGGEAVSFDELPAQLERVDIAVAATSSPHAILGTEEIAQVMEAREGRPLLMIDLAVPRDIDPRCREIEGVSLHDIDDLQAVVARNRSVRQAEARRAEAVVEDEMQRFASWLGSLEVLPTLTALREAAAAIVDTVLAENEERWESASPRDRERIRAISRTIVNRLLHEPTARVKALADDERAHVRVQVLRELFALDAEQDAGELAPVHRLPSRASRRG